MKLAHHLIYCFCFVLPLHLEWAVMSSPTNTPSKSSSSLTTKRILKELKEIKDSKLSFESPFNISSKDECGVRLFSVKNNLLEWHFSFTGVPGSNYQEGIYHGRILLHPAYPSKAPAIMLMTPTGRWETMKPICLSASSHHQETWDPNWNLRTLVMALRNHMATKPNEIGGILTSAETQIKLARLSDSWYCPLCGVHHTFLKTGNVPPEYTAHLQQIKESSSKNKDMLVRGKSRRKGNRGTNRRTVVSMESTLSFIKFVIPILALLAIQLWKSMLISQSLFA